MNLTFDNLPDLVLIEIFHQCTPVSLFGLALLNKRIYNIVFEVIRSNFEWNIYEKCGGEYKRLQKQFIKNNINKVKSLSIYNVDSLKLLDSCSNVKKINLNAFVALPHWDEIIVSNKLLMLTNLKVTLKVTDYDKFVSIFKDILHNIVNFEVYIEEFYLAKFIEILNPYKLKCLKVESMCLNLNELEIFKGRFVKLGALQLYGYEIKIPTGFKDESSFQSLKKLNIVGSPSHNFKLDYLGDLGMITLLNINLLGFEHDLILFKDSSKSKVQTLKLRECINFNLNNVSDMPLLKKVSIHGNELFMIMIEDVLPQSNIRIFEARELYYPEVRYLTKQSDSLINNYSYLSNYKEELKLNISIISKSVMEFTIKSSCITFQSFFNTIKSFPNLTLVKCNLGCIYDEDCKVDNNQSFYFQISKSFDINHDTLILKRLSVVPLVRLEEVY
ncbi:hypothetical protein K502DRAFT_348797 [Neoconidiobolus thromboides FSU 785]|nr:hypothetical protein K502DRAFT_348797 [Neoconidiobolus thromboides FSU 785]